MLLPKYAELNPPVGDVGWLKDSTVEAYTSRPALGEAGIRGSESQSSEHSICREKLSHISKETELLHLSSGAVRRTRAQCHNLYGRQDKADLTRERHCLPRPPLMFDDCTHNKSPKLT